MMVLSKFDPGDKVRWGPWEECRVAGFTVNSAGIVYMITYFDGNDEQQIQQVYDWELEIVERINKGEQSEAH